MTDQQLSTTENSHADFQARRLEAVTAPTGDLALVNTQWITGDPGAGQPIWGVTGIWSPAPGGEPGLVLTATADDNILLDGQPVTGVVLLEAGSTRLRFSPAVTGTIQAGDGAQAGDYALQIWDAQSPANRDFGMIETFPENADWLLPAVFEPGEGEIVFSHANETVRLRAQEEDGIVTVLFGDTTNGETTYSVGRYLSVTLPAQTIDASSQQLSLDFNRAWLPSCAFSYNFPCPLVPGANRLSFKVEAGERNVLAASGEPLHE